MNGLVESTGEIWCKRFPYNAVEYLSFITIGSVKAILRGVHEITHKLIQ